MRFRMNDGVILDTNKASAEYAEDTRWNGNNHISVNTGSQWEHETLYRSSRGRYYLVSWSDYQHAAPTCEYVSEEDAARWLILNNKEALPDDLAGYADTLME